MNCHFLLQGIFPTPGLNLHFLCLLHCRQILYLLSHWRSPALLPPPFSRLLWLIWKWFAKYLTTHRARSPTVVQFSSVQSLSRVWLFVTPWTTAHQASLSITNSQRSLKLMSIVSVMPSNHLILCRPLLLPTSIFPSIKNFSNESSGGQSIGLSASASVLPKNIQDWFPLGWTGWISLQSRDSQESSPTPQFIRINSSALSFLYNPTLTSIHDY